MPIHECLSRVSLDHGPLDCVSRHVASRPGDHDPVGTASLPAMEPTDPTPLRLRPDRCLASPHPSPPNTEPSRPTGWRLRRRFVSSLVAGALLILISPPIQPVDAVRIPFENCLPDNFKNNHPVPLQWVPLYVDAAFDTEKEGHNLRVTTWGNVTGSYSQVDLPPPESPDWRDKEKNDGKIPQIPFPTDDKPRATTLVTNVNVLTYEPYSHSSDFCQDSLINGTCPLGPIFDTRGLTLPYGLPAFNMSNDFFSSYAFTTFSVTFIIIYGDEPRTNIGCVSTPITPDLGAFAWMLAFLPLVALLSIGFATIFAAVFCPWGSTDIFKWSSNQGRETPDLLRLVTPGFGDCLQYIQFIALTGGLSLNYPGFYQPVTSRVAWSALMFNTSFVSKAPSWQSLVDGIYVTNSSFGLHRQAQLVGMAEVEDIWAGMMVWLVVIAVGVLVTTQIGFAIHWLYRYLNKIPEEDLRAKNVPFSLGNVVRLVFNYFLLPIVTISSFQLVVAYESPAYAVALAVVTLCLIIGFSIWLGRIIIKARPQSDLFDQLPTLLKYGPLYNTYSEDAAAFALVPLFLTLFRGLAMGCAQAYGVAQITMLASAEIICLLTLLYFRPFDRQTSMNAYQAVFSVIRLVTILLMVAFAPSFGVTEGPKGWIGYVILLIHGCVVVFGFFLNALQTLVEVIARMLGAGGHTTGGLSKIFGMRQLSRRMSRREHGPSRQSHLSSTAMLDAEQASKTGYVMPGGRVRSESAASIGGLISKQQRASSALDSVDMQSPPPRNFDSAASSFTPTTPGEASTFSFLPSPGRPPTGATMEASDPYYRPPRRRRETLTEPIVSNPNRESVAGSSLRRYSQAGGPMGDPAELDAAISRGATPMHSTQINLAPRADYSTREVDFYYGVRGPALNSERPGRKLGTGPADPTGPVATATGWLRTMFVGKSKEKGKGFEVVRSARMPPAMRARGESEDEPPPEGIPVAMAMLRNGPIESDDDDPGRPARQGPHTRGRSRIQDLESAVSRTDDGSDFEAPHIPRKSSRRHSSSAGHSRAPSFNLIPPIDSPTGTAPGSPRTVEPSPLQQNSLGITSGTSRLPFERSSSQRRPSSGSSLEAGDDLVQMDINRPRSDERPTSYGFVPRHGISRVDQGVDFSGSAAEVVDDRTPSSRGSSDGQRAEGRR